MSVDKFGRHESSVRVRKQTRRSLKEDIGLTLSDDGDINVENKRIVNLGDPEAANDAVPLHYVHDRCLLLPEQSGSGAVGRINVKGNRIVNADIPIDLKDVVNRYYVDDKCLQFRKSSGGGGTDTSVIDARDFRIISLQDPIQARDAANKRYVDSKSLMKDQFGNVSMSDHRITNVQEPLMNKDVTNLEFVYNNTVSLQGVVFNANGKIISNLANGEADRDAVNFQQLTQLKLFIKSELYKIVKVFATRIDKLVIAIHKLHGTEGRRSLDFNDLEEVSRLIKQLDRRPELEDWRNNYQDISYVSPKE